ncbi:MAG: hypothetical protein QOD24_975 [Solirubrobacteraceae bacterium]|jgi:hypothetical protein|nr:hypothetical protein [Solirubrobacteraceae bacterium]
MVEITRDDLERARIENVQQLVVVEPEQLLKVCRAQES